MHTSGKQECVKSYVNRNCPVFVSPPPPSIPVQRRSDVCLVPCMVHVASDCAGVCVRSSVDRLAVSAKARVHSPTQQSEDHTQRKYYYTINRNTYTRT